MKARHVDSKLHSEARPPPQTMNWTGLVRAYKSVRDRFLMLLIRLFMIWPLKASTFAVYGYWIFRLGRRLQKNLSGQTQPQPATTKGSLLGFLFRYAMGKIVRFWLSLEAGFFIFYLFKHRQLQGQKAKPPRMNIYAQPGSAHEIMLRIFQATDDIHAAGKIVQPELSRALSRQLTPSASAQDIQAILHPQVNESSMEGLLREWDDFAASPTSNILSPQPGLHVTPSSQRLEDIEAAETLALKRAEVSGWFLHHRTQERWPAVRLHEIGLDNLAEFAAWVFFHCTPQEMPTDRSAELQSIIDRMSKWVDVEFPGGYNAEVQSMRLTMDTIKSEHRPLAYYVVTAAFLPAITAQVLTRFGFQRHTSGTLSYWCRPSMSHTGGIDCGAADKSSIGRGTHGCHALPPYVICLGIGVGAIQYYALIKQIMEINPERAMFIVSLPSISMKLTENVPSSAEMVPCISDMLASWGHRSAHFVGHSFGTILMSWILQRAPSMVSFATFIDPVCFLLVKPDVCYNFVYRPPSSPTQLLLSYFGARELFLAHSLSRNFFWSENIIWPEQLSKAALVVLSGRDSIVPAHSVRRYLTAYKKRHGMRNLKVLWYPHLGHGEFLLPGKTDTLAEIVKEMVILESVQHATVGGPDATQSNA